MPRGEHERAVQLSLLDRLLDEEPLNRNEAPLTRERSLRLFRAAVKRDLEALLNTTRTIERPGDSYPELENSLWLYGFPDINSITLQNVQDEQRMLSDLERAIMKFEPRLTRVRVTAFNRISKLQQKVEFHVEAMLMIQPAPERIAFDTVLEIGKGAYRVED